MAAGRLPVDLPYLKREALAALTTDYPGAAAARAAIATRLGGFYRDTYPEVSAARQDAIARAIDAVQQIWARNVFPEMKVGWGTYPDNIGHQDFPGCFRCHDELHATADGTTISQDCSTCHSLLAMEEEKPAVLETLFPEEK